MEMPQIKLKYQKQVNTTTTEWRTTMAVASDLTVGLMLQLEIFLSDVKTS